MCGICGVYHFDAQVSADEETVRRMCGQIVHRGPDEEGIYVDGPIGLGMRRLSIIDLEGGSQPIFNENASVAVIQNGEIYNFQGLRRSLQDAGHHFSTLSDTEVIVHLYEQHELDFVKHLNGMFAIALWDNTRRRLVLVRDRLGVKPLYYAELGNAVVFGSEIKCLLQHPLVSTDLDYQAIYNYFALGYIPAPRTVFRGIRKLPPGCYLTADKQTVKLHSYWSVPREIDHEMTEREAIDQLRELLQDAVRLRMISDVPLGAFLSGGLDSSIVVALMAQQTERPIKTFFIDFDEPSHSEREYARSIAHRYGTDHHEFTVRPDALDILPKVIDHFDEPFADASAIPTWYVSQLTRKHVTVALAGDAGDESFGGYNRYRRILKRRELRYARRFFRPFVSTLSGLLPRQSPGKRLLRSLGSPNSEYYAVDTQEYEARLLLSDDVLGQVDKSVAEEVNGLSGDISAIPDKLAPYSRYDLRWYLPDDILTKVDRMSMAHSLEVRGPFLDYRVVELASRMPSRLKLNPMDSKLILKKAFGCDLPPEVLKPRKRGFSMPLERWFREDSRFQELCGAVLKDNGVLEHREVSALWREHTAGVRDRSSQLWRILVFAIWLESNSRVRALI